jgi:hypothetical protein
MKRSHFLNFLVLAVFITFGAGVAHASSIAVTLGAPGAGIASGDQLSIGQWNTAAPGVSDLAAFQGFDNNVGPSLTTSFTFNYVIPAGETIVSAAFTLGIYDHDSAAAGDQVASFMLDSSNLTSSLNIAFNSSGGSSVFIPPSPNQTLVLTSEYNVYTLGLLSVSDLADGSLTASLQLKNGFAYPLGVPTNTLFNGAAIDFARLNIETRTTGTPPVPEPASFALIVVGLGAIAGFWRIEKRRMGRL